MSKTRWITPNWPKMLSYVLMLGVVILLLGLFGTATTAEMINIFLIGTLVIVTALYAAETAKLSNSSEQQARASTKMAEMASRPIVIQKIVSHPKQRYFSNFEIYNAGNGPAIELEISTVYEKKGYAHAIRETYLRAGDSRKFKTDFATLKENTRYHLVCEYQGISSLTGEQTWYQTWLPFEFAKSSKEGEVYVTAGELVFKDEVPEKERINAFPGKPKR